MHCSLRRGEAEDQPPAAGVNGVKAEDVSQEGAVRLGVRAVEDQVCTEDHRRIMAYLDTTWCCIQTLGSQ